MSTNEQPRRKQAERRRESENALLAAAAEVIAERGVTGASLASIGARAGTSRGLTNHHFGSKKALVSQLAASAQDRISAATVGAIERAHRHLEELTALELVRASVDTYLELFEHPTADERALIVMWGATFPTKSSVEGLLDAERRAYDGWAALIQQGQKEGSIRPELDPGAAAVMLHGLTRGVAALLLTESDYTDMRRVRRTVDDVLAAALAPPTGKVDPLPGKGRGAMTANGASQHEGAPRSGRGSKRVVAS